MIFLNRIQEKHILSEALQREAGGLIVIYGRRRCGKSTLIKNAISHSDVYFMAQQTDEAIQRSQLASAIADKIQGFDNVIYPTWESLFINCNSSPPNILVRKLIFKNDFSALCDNFSY
jgi:AAA+ ATPase superfamily predicted ATPase